MKLRYSKIFYSSSGTKLKVKFTQNSDNTLEIEVSNEEYFSIRRSKIKWCIVVAFIYFIYMMMATHYFIPNFMFTITILVIMYTLSGLVRSGMN